ALAPLLADSADALAADRGADLEAVAEQWTALALAPLAVESYTRAARAYTTEGYPAAARRARGHAIEIEATMEAPGPMRIDADERVALTAREREVGLLAARGLTNNEIASQLAVSVRTVHTHLQSVYAKLGVNQREHLDRLLNAPVGPAS